jgi:concentrative nucleoside transporter, CNT family
MIGLLGILALVGLAWLLSERKSRVPWKLVAGGIGVQFLLALLLLRIPVARDVFEAFARLVTGLIDRSQQGIEFVFGPEAADASGSLGFVFAFQVLPIIVFFAALMSVLYYVRVMPLIIAGLAWLLRRTLGVTGAESLAMAANVFVGQTEAPLTVKPLIERMTRAQIATLMVGGFATIAGSVLVAFTDMLGGDDPERRVLFAKHLITASVLSAPAAFVMARIIVPETESPPDEGSTGDLLKPADQRAANVFDAAALGATDGLKLALNVGAMLIAFLALLSVINWPLEALSDVPAFDTWLADRGIEELNLQTILGFLLAPIAWLIGVDWADARVVGSLMGQKMLVTEFVAFGSLRNAIADGAISDRSAQIAAYALCGFANFGSIAIQIGGLSAIAPGQRATFSTLALRAMIAGALASFITAAVAGILL